MLGLDEALARVPGLYMQNRYNFAQDLKVSLRAFGARSSFGIRGVRIFVDDIPESLPDGQAQVASIDLGSTSGSRSFAGPRLRSMAMRQAVSLPFTASSVVTHPTLKLAWPAAITATGVSN